MVLSGISMEKSPARLASLYFPCRLSPLQSLRVLSNIIINYQVRNRFLFKDIRCHRNSVLAIITTPIEIGKCKGYLGCENTKNWQNLAVQDNNYELLMTWSEYNEKLHERLFSFVAWTSEQGKNADEDVNGIKVDTHTSIIMEGRELLLLRLNTSIG